MKTKKKKISSVFLIILTTLIFSIQDSFSFFLSINYNIFQIIMLRYWFLALILLFFFFKEKKYKKSIDTSMKILHILRGTILVFEICFTVYCFKLFGLTNSHAIFVTYPLITFIIAKFFLNEETSWRFYFSVILGVIGVFFIINSKNISYDISILIPLLSSFLFSVYGVLTRYTSRKDDILANYFFTILPGILIISPLGIYYWQSIQTSHFSSILFLCIISGLGFFTFIKAYDTKKISKLQPFAYFQSIFASIIGIFYFGDEVTFSLLLGAIIVIFAGMFVMKKIN